MMVVPAVLVIGIQEVVMTTAVMVVGPRVMTLVMAVWLRVMTVVEWLKVMTVTVTTVATVTVAVVATSVGTMCQQLVPLHR